MQPRTKIGSRVTPVIVQTRRCQAIIMSKAVASSQCQLVERNPRHDTPSRLRYLYDPVVSHRAYTHKHTNSAGLYKRPSQAVLQMASTTASVLANRTAKDRSLHRTICTHAGGMRARETYYSTCARKS